jgi:trans-aconitate 2-methyltransferase
MSQRVEWNAERYHAVSRPHEVWGARVLDRVPTSGVAVTIDAGCGTGKITRELLDRLPDAVVHAVDVSPAMLEVAERELAPIYGDRVRFHAADLSCLTQDDIGTRADLIFSTATLHWISDHALLFRRLFDLLDPGGWLIAQCGGGPNIARLCERADRLMHAQEYAAWFADWQETWYFAGAEETATRLADAGFADIETGIEYHPAIMADAAEFHSFVTTVILRNQLARLPEERLKVAVVDELTRLAAEDDPPFELDFWRLNIRAMRP